MFELQYFLIGLIQGVTEFLPISSSGHLVLFAELAKWEDQGLFTDITVHFGTLFAVIFYMRKEIIFLISNILACGFAGFPTNETSRKSIFSRYFVNLSSSITSLISSSSIPSFT